MISKYPSRGVIYRTGSEWNWEMWPCVMSMTEIISLWYFNRKIIATESLFWFLIRTELPSIDAHAPSIHKFRPTQNVLKMSVRFHRQTRNCRIWSCHSRGTFWDRTPCSPVKVRRCFGRAYFFHLLGWRVSRGSNHHERELPASRWLFAWLTLQPLRRGPYAAPKHGLNFTGLYAVISHNTESFRYKIIYIDSSKNTERSVVIDLFRATHFIIRNKQIKK
jgi:hypothetical protein